jgi:hypothetical protein
MESPMKSLGSQNNLWVSNKNLWASNKTKTFGPPINSGGHQWKNCVLQWKSRGVQNYSKSNADDFLPDLFKCSLCCVYNNLALWTLYSLSNVFNDLALWTLYSLRNVFINLVLWTLYSKQSNVYYNLALWTPYSYLCLCNDVINTYQFFYTTIYTHSAECTV